jgi:hypothetical protein
MWRAVRRRWRVALALLAGASVLLAGCGAPPSGGGSSAPSNISRFQHIFLIVMENSDYDDIIGSSKAPHLNALANQYGLATNYWAVSHPSEPNYVAMVGGSTFGIADDASYTVNAESAPYLGSQLEGAGLSWKSYQQGLPHPGYLGETANTNGALYASKHNPFMNFLTHYPETQRPEELAKIVPDTQLAADLVSGSVPNFSFISPGLCDDMHGDPACGDEDTLTSAGDTYVNTLVTQIMQASVWSQGNNAIIVTWDESSLGVALGPFGIAAGGGHVATIVITNHGPRGVKDGTAYNHYALLLTIQDAFGLGCLQNSCPATGGVTPMSQLLGD